MQVSEFSMPNLLAGKKVVEELIQEQATAENMAAALIRLIENPDRMREIEMVFTELYETLHTNASELAAGAVLDLLKTQEEAHG
jgi:lipid-A-disaccharide synthase